MEDFVPYWLAVKLKEKGFKEKCYAYYFPTNHELCYNINQLRGGILYDCLYSYNSFPKEVVTSDFIDAPTISQVLMWLREKKKIFVILSISPLINEEVKWSWDTGCFDNKKTFRWRDGNYGYDSYEQAAIAGVNYCLDNLI